MSKKLISIQSQSTNTGYFPIAEVSQPINQLPTPPSESTGLLTIAQIRQEYPCNNCSAPCCSYLPLHTFNISNIRELDHALYLLNFPRIELGLSGTGEWGVYYRYPCRFLNRENGQCTIYGDELRPSICATYSPYSCWYKRVIGPNVHQTFLRINKDRMDVLLEKLIFDEDLNLVSIPDWPTIISLFEKLPISKNYNEDFGEEDSVFDRWLYEAAYSTSEKPVAEETHSYLSLINPCTDCGAFCCKYLVFPQSVPTTRVTLDYLQFVLGFPGLEIGISDGAWFIILQARCQHLRENKCSIFGKPERPHICTFYDAHGCQYVAQFGVPRPNDFMRIKLEQFFWLVETIGFDMHGNINHIPTTEEIRLNVERQWHDKVFAETE